MILAFDTYYYADKAKTVCLSFKEWTDESYSKIYSEIQHGIEEYESGEFYKRELPCIVSLLEQINLLDIEAIIIDGFVFLDDNGKLGLGGHLYEYLKGKIPIIGVAKTNFATINQHKQKVYRGNSKNPLYVTAIGLEKEEAAKHIESMSGAYRMPTLLKQLDSLTKDRQL